MREYHVSFTIREDSDEFWDNIAKLPSHVERCEAVKSVVVDSLGYYGIYDVDGTQEVKVVESIDGQLSLL